ncbi:MAG: hypothetical protein ABEK84_03875, partial [Salinibacter sp.]
MQAWPGPSVNANPYGRRPSVPRAVLITQRTAGSPRSPQHRAARRAQDDPRPADDQSPDQATPVRIAPQRRAQGDARPTQNEFAQ